LRNLEKDYAYQSLSMCSTRWQLESCSECGGLIEERPTDDAVLEKVCTTCGIVVESIRFSEFLLPSWEAPRPRSRLRQQREARIPSKLDQLLGTIDPNWHYAVPRFTTSNDPNPVLSSLFWNPFIGIGTYKERKHKVTVRGFDEQYVVDLRRTDKERLHIHIRWMLDRALKRFKASTSKLPVRRKGLFAACLYMEGIVECYEAIKLGADILGGTLQPDGTDGKLRFRGSSKARRYIRAKSVTPKGLDKWASRFHVSRNTLDRRIVELESEAPGLADIAYFVRHF
jgi:hypothetical protein